MVLVVADVLVVVVGGGEVNALNCGVTALLLRFQICGTDAVGTLDTLD